jgi:hypothetical protein
MTDLIIDFIFIFFFLISTSVKDIYNMAKSELIYWGYNPKHLGAYDETASDNSSKGQFGLMYFYAFTAAFVLVMLGHYTIWKALWTLLRLGILHWCGVEDLGYYFFERWIRFPKEYVETHEFVNILGWRLAKNLPWLSRVRKVWIFKIPSLIGFVCGKDVVWWKFLILSIFSIILAVYISFII